MVTANSVSPEQMLEHIQACYVEMLYVYNDAKAFQGGSGDQEYCLMLLSCATTALRSVHALERVVKDMASKEKQEAGNWSVCEMA